jgi:hypothetical protein
MKSVLVSEPDVVWLQHENYEIVPLNARGDAPIPELAEAFRQGIPACPDSKRRDFYEINLSDGWAYIHVHDAARTVYLVAYSDSVGV